MRRHWSTTLADWKRLGGELDTREAALHEKLPQPGRHTLANKRLLLLRRILEEIGWSDVGIVDDFVAVLPVVGPLPVGGVFLEVSVLVSLSCAEVLRAAPSIRRRIIDSVGLASVDADTTTLKGTPEEIQSKGSMLRPFTEAEIDRRHGKLWIPSRRFAILKGVKTLADGSTVPEYRQIHDYSESCVNAAESFTETVTPSGTDVHAANIKGLGGCDVP